jgi:GrpB-like predicted nucleotidyltransferase (UPF0157 family)
LSADPRTTHTARVVVVDHDPAWSARFAAAAAALVTLVPTGLVAVEHVGSTAVPGLAAKPIIDVLLLLDDVTRLDALEAAFGARGFVAKGEFGIPGRRYFSRGPDHARTEHVHAFSAGAPEAQRHRDLRDYLIAHPAAARRYGETKRRLARAHPEDIHAYMDGKHGLVRELLAAAADWRRRAADFPPGT